MAQSGEEVPEIGARWDRAGCTGGVCDGLGSAWALSRERPRQLRQRVCKDREAGLGQGTPGGERVGRPQGQQLERESRLYAAANAVETKRPRCRTRLGSKCGRERGFLAKGWGVLWVMEDY